MLEFFADDANAQLYVTKLFDHFPLFDKPVRHTKLCNGVISHICARKFANSFLTV